MLATKFGIIPSAGSMWLDGWSYGKKLTIPATSIDADLTNFPLPVYLDATNFDFTKAKADGSDIRFTDKNLNQLKFERKEHSNVTPRAVYNVQVLTVTDSVDTEVYMWYGNSSAYNASMEAHQDMTGKALTYNGNVKLVTGVQTGKRVASFDGSGDYFSLADSEDWNVGNGDFTYEAILTVGSTYGLTVGGQLASSGSNSTGSFVCSIANTEVGFQCFVGGTAYEAKLIATQPTNTTLHFAVVRSGANQHIAVNGTIVKTLSTIGTGVCNNSTEPFLIAKRGDLTASYLGSINGIRMTKGSARYTANFTPPTTFTIDSANVVFCTNFDTIYDANYVLVNHMGNSLVDATGGGNNGTATGTTVVDTAYGKARQFAGGTNVISHTDAYGALNFDSFLYNHTITVFHISSTINQSAKRLIEKRVSGAYPYSFQFNVSNGLQLLAYDGTNAPYSTIDNQLDGNYHINTLRVNNPTDKLIGNGDGNANVEVTNTTTTNTANVAPVRIGNDATGTTGFTGNILEVRLSNIARSDAWIKAESLGLKNTLLKIENVYEVLADITVQSAVTSVDFTGLNIGKGDEVMLVSSIPNASDIAYSIYVNGNVTSTNYYYQKLSADSTTIARARGNSAILGDSISPLIMTPIKLTNSGYFVWQSNEIRNVGTSAIRLWNGYGTSTFTSTSITQLTITAGATDGIVIGSRFQLYRCGRGI